MSNTLSPEFLRMLRSQSFDAEPVIDALQAAEPSVSVRVNPHKGVSVPEGALRVPWSRNGFYLNERPVFAADPGWHQGMYYVQEASSMAEEAAVRTVVKKYFGDREDLCVLDACASPGGKSLGAMAALPAGAYIVANEPDRHRANILAENLGRWGFPDVSVTRADARSFSKLKSQFDIIIADMPCSGEGMMRKEEKAVTQWSESLVDSCAALQREIAGALMEALRPGGVLIYSTCTFNPQEDDINVCAIAREWDCELVPLEFEYIPGVQVSEGNAGYRFMPGYVRGEGFFIAAIRKNGEHASPSADKFPLREDKEMRALISQHAPKVADKYMAIGGEHPAIIPRAHLPLAAALLKSRLPLLRLGLPAALMKGRELLPAHELVMSTVFDKTSLPVYEADYPTAMAYLRGEALTGLPEDLPRGAVTLTWQGEPLGLVKNIGRRANNLYPEAWKLHLPPSATTVCPQILSNPSAI